MRRKLNPGAPRNPDYHRYVMFRFGRPYRHYFGYIARGVISFPLVGRRPTTGEDAVRRAARCIVSRYRAALDAAVEAGHLSIVQAHTMGNCRPAIAQAAPATRFCGAANICPHCWARRAIDYWTRIDAALFPRADGQRAAAATHDLVQVVRRYGPRELQPHWKSQLPLKSILDDRLSRSQDGRPNILGSRGREWRQLSGRFDVAWCVEGLVFDPVFAGPRRGLWVAARQLFAVPPGAAFEVPGGKVTRLATPSRLEVARAVIRLCRYPRGLLIGAPGPQRILTPVPPGVFQLYHDVTLGRKLWMATGGLPTAGLASGEGESEA